LFSKTFSLPAFKSKIVVLENSLEKNPLKAKYEKVHQMSLTIFAFCFVLENGKSDE
jgi:hypothetical protein